jgi:hypothetical protein
MTVDGTNVVDAGKQRFQPSKGGDVTFTGQFHDLTITAHDALSNGRVATTAVVTAPDGRVRTVPFGRDHTATVSGLPRGNYVVDVKGADGVVFTEQFTLSRDKSVDVMVASVRDLALTASFGLVFVLGLLLAGRRHLRRRLRAPAELRLRRFRTQRTLRRLRRRIPV